MATNSKIIIPGITKKDLIDYNEIFLGDNPCISLSTLCFLLAWRAQISSNLNGLLTSQEIQQLESMRWIAKQLSTNIQVKNLAALIAITRTLGFEAAHLASLQVEERMPYLRKLTMELALTRPPRGVKMLSNSQITNENLIKHRLGIMAQLYGLWQSKPLYDPNLVVRGTLPAQLDIDTFCALINNLWIEMLGTDNLPTFEQIIELRDYIPIRHYSTGEEDVNIYQPLLEADGRIYNLQEGENLVEQPTIFNDGISISKLNLFILEAIFLYDKVSFIQRPLPSTIDPVETPSGDTDPLLSRAVSSNQSIRAEQSRSTKKRPAKLSPATSKEREDPLMNARAYKPPLSPADQASVKPKAPAAARKRKTNSN
jgi:hypothetical protein